MEHSANFCGISRAEYWVSQAKKFCEFCKCWITDNKPVGIVLERF